MGAIWSPAYHLRYVDEAFRRVGLLPADSPAPAAATSLVQGD